MGWLKHILLKNLTTRSSVPRNFCHEAYNKDILRNILDFGYILSCLGYLNHFPLLFYSHKIALNFIHCPHPNAHLHIVQWTHCCIPQKKLAVPGTKVSKPSEHRVKGKKKNFPVHLLELEWEWSLLLSLLGTSFFHFHRHCTNHL